MAYKLVEGDTPLMLAVKAGSEDVVENMLKMWLDEIDFNAKNVKGEMVHHMAPNARMVVMLREAEEKQEAGEGWEERDEENE